MTDLQYHMFLDAQKRSPKKYRHFDRKNFDEFLMTGADHGVEVFTGRIYLVENPRQYGMALSSQDDSILFWLVNTSNYFQAHADGVNFA